MLLITDGLLLNAIKKFEEVKKQYVKNNILTNPAVLIQINNDYDPKKELKKYEEFNKELEKIVDFINNKSNSHNSLKYYITFDIDAKVKKSNRRYEKLSFNELAYFNCDIDVIIFKVGALVGWDIPRANMLVQLRKVNSENLQTQTIGIIMMFLDSNNKNLYSCNCLEYYYVFSNVLAKDNNKIIYKIKEKFANPKLKFSLPIINNCEELQRKYVNDNLVFIKWLKIRF